MTSTASTKRDWPPSLWAHTAPPAQTSGALDRAVTVDVAIIGAGFTGLRAALHLAEAGTNVAVLDATDVGWGASGRTGGQVNPMMPFNSPAKIEKMIGGRAFTLLAEQSLNSADEVFDLIKTYQIDCQARQKGWLRVLHSSAAHKKAEADVRNWVALGATMKVVDQGEVTRLSGSSAYQSGIVNPRGGAIQPLMYARGLAETARQRGAQIFSNSAVTSLTKVGDKWRLTTAQGQVEAAWVIIATNGYTDKLIPNLAETIIPITPIQIASDPLPPEVIDSVLPEGHTISDSRRVIMYARREPDNRIVYGGHGETDKNGNLIGFDWLVKDAERVFPQLKGITWTHRWGGRIAVTSDHLPHLHEPKPGLLVGLGYNGRGVAMANVMGRVMAERVLGAEPSTLPFPVTDITKIPMRALQLFGMPFVIRMMRLRDYLETR